MSRVDFGKTAEVKKVEWCKELVTARVVWVAGSLYSKNPLCRLSVLFARQLLEASLKSMEGMAGSSLSDFLSGRSWIARNSSVFSLVFVDLIARVRLSPAIGARISPIVT